MRQAGRGHSLPPRGASHIGNGRNVVDPLVIYHQLEPRDLRTAYLKYCGKNLEDAHSSISDVRAAAEVFNSQLDFYADLPMVALHQICPHPREPDWIDDEGRLLNSEEGPLLGFGKYRGRMLKEIAEMDQEYLVWVCGTDFSRQVKDIVGTFLV